jgi:hypothetical protein
MKFTTFGFLVWALVGLTASVAQSSTIIKLNLGSVGPDVMTNQSGVLTTTDDGIVATTGNQNTAVEYTGFLDPVPDINSNTASFSLSGVQSVGSANVFGSLAIQNYTGGQFSLYDPANTLLLQGTLSNSSLSGTIGAPGTGALFTTNLGTVTGGTLASLIQPGTLSLALNLTNVNGGSGLAVSGGALLPFVADSSVNISADQIIVPEPSTLALLTLGAVGFMIKRRMPAKC